MTGRYNDRMIGDVRLTRIEESCTPLFHPKNWYADYNEEELAPVLKALPPGCHDPSTGFLTISIHSWVVRQNGRTILIDTCVGNHKNRPSWGVFDQLNTDYLDRLRAAGVEPEEVDMVMCTHLHVDHVGWNTRLENGRWVPTFPNAKYVMSRADLAYFEKAAATEDKDVAEVNRQAWFDSVLPVIEAGQVLTVEGIEELGPGLMLRPAPGHSPGQMRLDVNSRGQRACLCGDVMHHPLQVPLWRWRTFVCADPEKAVETRREILEHCAEQDVIVMPAHFAPPYGGHIKARGDEFSILFDRM
ncbi:MBL fold metallo-hydrolase [Labrys sp. LIt4]|uniref:MBL fold metallo-hydrolase n=1 Tax=Labrys sp. LIt4 TaxID=2821355 RepID=UPI001ADF00DF|nr:MBL fold metallo-hydrolase [Labrys sp. LIt4]MBP0580525.1 MBL fold metallo-hydrolase [Labrys sp. LIt4]